MGIVRDWCSRKGIGYDEFAILAERIEEYWLWLKNRYLLIDMQYLSEQVRKYLEEVAFPLGEEGELCQLVKDDVESMIRM